MVELFVSYEYAVKLKELGFEESCLAWWVTPSKLQYCFNHNSADGMKNDISAPLWSQAFEWLLKKYNVSMCMTIFELDAYYWKLRKINLPIGTKERIGKSKKAKSLFDANKEAMGAYMRFIKQGDFYL